ncbi:MAG: class I SAM-dependent methyltransferase [Cytophagales bacterium]|nr:class I SAM-dependent methyltransferase [Bernardetiaceae bacterium]MDW8205216.1 class I SAM-dependent methyltransferase [Cytophagales bacterium]
MLPIQALAPVPWSDYELIDCGNFEKLERFGKYIVARPEPQAVWDKSLPEPEWQKLAGAWFRREANDTDRHSERGKWYTRTGQPEKWWMHYRRGHMNLQLKISLSSFKHVGIFPEQAVNWDYLVEKIAHMPIQSPRVLNLFAYTGIASLAARHAGAEVTHVDAVKQVISWARESMEASQLDGIRWIVEDAPKFVAREVRRGNRYQGLILDPPAYGRGPNGEKWILEDHINNLLKNCAQILDPSHYFCIINLYSMGFSPLIVENLVNSIFTNVRHMEIGELYLPDRFGKRLPLGIFCRFTSC